MPLVASPKKPGLHFSHWGPSVLCWQFWERATCYRGVVILHCVPVPLAPHQLLPPYQAVSKNGVTSAGVAVAATARAGPQIRSPHHPLKTGGTALARQPCVAHGAPGDRAL